MLRTTALAAMTALMLTVSAYADGIVGKWKTDSGAIAEIAPSGGGFVITVRSGAHNGKRIGQMNPAGNGKYKGEITDRQDLFGQRNAQGELARHAGLRGGDLLQDAELEAPVGN